MSPREQILAQVLADVVEEKEEDEEEEGAVVPVLLPTAIATTTTTIVASNDERTSLLLLPTASATTTINDDKWYGNGNGDGYGDGGDIISSTRSNNMYNGIDYSDKNDNNNNNIDNTSNTVSGSSPVSIISSICHEVMEQSKTFLPTLQSLILSKIPWFITLRILGQMDDDQNNDTNTASDHNNTNEKGVELAAAALATTLCNVTGMSLCVGFSFALSTLAGQAKGEMFSRNNKHNRSSSSSMINTPIVYLLRAMIIQLVVVFPVGIWWMIGIESLLVQLGQTPIVAQAAAHYLKILAPSLWVYSMQWTITAWSQSIGLADVPATASLWGLGMHLPFNYFFVYGLNFGYLGCAYATICFQTIQFTYIALSLFVTQKGKHRVLHATGGAHIGRNDISIFKSSSNGNVGNGELYVAFSSLQGYREYLNLALPGIVIISEWWASETAIFLSGKLEPNPQTTLAAMTIYQSINAFCFQFPCGLSTAGCARVSNLLGGGSPLEAKFAASINVGLCGIVSGMIGLLLYIVPHTYFPSLFLSNQNNQAIIDQTAATIPFLSIYVFADGIQTGMNGIIKGCGRQKIVVPIVVVAYWIIGVPLAYYLGLVRNHNNALLCTSTTTNSTHDDIDNTDHGTMTFCGDVGLVAGMTAGTWFHMLTLAFIVIYTTNWRKEAIKAKERVKQQ